MSDDQTGAGRPHKRGFEKIRVLVVEDSAFMRDILSNCLTSSPDIEVIGYAENGLTALSQTLALRPDVITLDIQLPFLNGLDSLRKIMERRPTPVLVLSQYSTHGSAVSLEALERGAVDFMPKPGFLGKLDLSFFARLLTRKIREVAKANLDALNEQALDDGEPMEAALGRAEDENSFDSKVGRIVVVGASTGGPPALRRVLSRLPKDLASPIVIVQHIPTGYDRPLQQRLREAGPLEVSIPEDGTECLPGHVYLAPADLHVVLDRNRAGFVLQLEEGSGFSEYVPSIDVLFRSAAQCAGEHVIGIILTGMGSDGVKGMGAIREAGGITVAQDESTSTIFGMPKEAYATGSAQYMLPIAHVADFIASHTNSVWSPAG